MLKEHGTERDFCKMKCFEMLAILPKTNGLRIFRHILGIHYNTESYV